MASSRGHLNSSQSPFSAAAAAAASSSARFCASRSCSIRSRLACFAASRSSAETGLSSITSNRQWQSKMCVRRSAGLGAPAVTVGLMGSPSSAAAVVSEGPESGRPIGLPDVFKLRSFGNTRNASRVPSRRSLFPAKSRLCRFVRVAHVSPSTTWNLFLAKMSSCSSGTSARPSIVVSSLPDKSSLVKAGKPANISKFFSLLSERSKDWRVAWPVYSSSFLLISLLAKLTVRSIGKGSTGSNVNELLLRSK
mmetsp:Transcript_10120/g.22765  ORF Transcript_10120/g.22765 Transcript_10120/m.22765 type:complete len:251 (-) Transcript_10120:466-1218(-)